MKNKRGITLIALIITIIILVILAGITFNAIAGDNGILSQAMKSKTNTENASAISMVEMAWSARMTKFLEEKDRVVDNLYLKELLVDLNAGLGDSGKIKGIDYNETSNKFTLVYEDESGNNYYMDVDRASGKTSLSENHVEEQTVAEELASSYAVTEKSISKSKLYGTRVETGVTEINGVEVEDNWKIFYVDESDSKVYLIYGAYFPNSGLQNIDETIVKRNTAKFGGIGPWLNGGLSVQEYILEYLTNSENWNQISEELSKTGKTFAGKNILAIGGPSVEIWVKSFNDKYLEKMDTASFSTGDTYSYFDYGNYVTEQANFNGTLVTRDATTSPIHYDYNVGASEYVLGVKTSSVLSNAYNDNPDGNRIENLYFSFPFDKLWKTVYDLEWDRILGYWISSVNCKNGCVFASFGDGSLSYYNNGINYVGFRPVVSMSIADFESATEMKVH